VPFRDIAGLITRERILETIRMTDRGMRDWGMGRPRLGVAALNPHGGDGGLMGDEEERAIAPAVRDARAQGIDARGPFPADSIFVRALHGEFDAVVAMYHDQGHIPIKVRGFEESVTVTLGLPVVRTSVDHGTAFDIAWKGVAKENSMVEAIRLATRICATRSGSAAST
jgi:4-hydroxythreonine-4-phosphate dehydrogenase